MNDFVEGVKERTRSIDLCLCDCFTRVPRWKVDDIIKEWILPRKLLWHRIEVFTNVGVLEFDEDDEEVIRMPVKNLRVISNIKREAEMPFNAKDLELTPREKLVIKALNRLKIASVDYIMEFLTSFGDEIASREAIYPPIKKLVYLGLIQQISKENPHYNIKGRRKYYKPLEPIEVTESNEELLAECREYYERKFGKEEVKHA